ncbi:MAG TPA: adenylate/guanylate cyclase domain-containing protein [Oligoflexus sp.]|uniref:tetratricopeptide repeat protein n=1 Tax=Oligoflexus sp. TaxID=1971216 RepID=UPI002D5C645C|nr:adenylate/guanylate cyclase domain-containing protein [Oligoflexus sp.]HYX37869.1 adenylate/guanylate cyclase domain-containing protein [Oligoflexus sp.]
MLRMVILAFLLSSLAVSHESRGQTRAEITEQLAEAQDLLRDVPAKAHTLLTKIQALPALPQHPDLRFKAIQLILEYEGRMKIYTQTEALLAESEQLLRQLNDPKAEIDWLLAQAAFAYEGDKIDGIRTSLNRAYDLSLKLGDVEAQATILAEQGSLDRLELNYQGALVHYLQAYDLIKDRPNSDAYERVANQLAVFYLVGLTVRYDEGIKLLEELVQQAESSPKPRRQDLQIFISNLGSAYSKKGQHDRARQSFERAVRLAYEIEDWTGLAYCQGYIATVFIKEKKWAAALPYLNKAQQYFVKTKNRQMITLGAERLMTVHIELGQQKLAAENWTIVQSDGDKNLPLHQRVERMQLKGRLAAMEKRWKEAYESFEQMNRLEEKLNAQKNADSARYYTALFNLEHKSQENRRLEQKGRVQVMQLENKRKQSEVLTWILVSVSVIALIFAVDFFRVRKRRQKIQDLMEGVQKTLLQRYLPTRTVEAVLAGNQKLDTEPAHKTITLLQCELCDFTRAVELLGPQRIGRILNVYLGEMMDIIGSEGGMIDKFVNGSLLAVFGAPSTLSFEEQAQVATRCARRMQDKLQELNRNWQRSDGWVFAMRMGLHQGESLIGSLGMEPRKEYTVIGPVVDVASQICSRGAPGDTLVSASLAMHLDARNLQSVSRLRSGSDSEIFSLMRVSA